MLCSSKATDKLQCKLTAVIKRQPCSVAVIPKLSHFFHTCNPCSVARDMSSESRQCDMSFERYSLRIVTGCHIQIRRVIRGTGGNGSSRTAWYSFRVKHSLELSCRPGLDILSFLDVGCLCVFPLDFLLRLLICDVFVVFALWLVVFALSESRQCIHITSDEEPALVDRSVSFGHGTAL